MRMLAVFGAGLALGWWLGLSPARSAPRAERAPDAGAIELPAGAAAARGDSGHVAVPAGEGRITGRVRDARGRPVTDALVVLDPVRPGVGYPETLGAAGPPEMEWHRRLAKAAARRRALRREVRTTADGSYGVEGLPDDRYRVRAFVAGHKVVRRDPAGGDVRPGDTVDFVASALVRIDFRIQAPTGAGLDPLTLIFRGKDTRVLTRPVHRHVWLVPGEYRVTASAGANREYRSKEVFVAADPDRPGGPVVLTLSGRSGFRARVRTPAGLRPTSVAVEYTRIEGAPPAAPAALLAQLHKSASRQNGVFTAFDLEPGRYLVGVRAGSTVRYAEVRTIEVATGPVELEFLLQPSAQAWRVRLVVPEGSARRASVSSSYAHPRQGRIGGPSAAWRTDGDVFLVAPPVVETPLPGASWLLKASVPGYGSLRVRVEREARDVEIRFAKPGRLACSLGPHPERLRGEFRLRLLRRDQGFSNYSRAFSGDRYEFAPLQPGSYVLWLERGDDRVPLSRRVVDVAEGANSVTVEVPALYDLVVEIDAAGDLVWATLLDAPRDEVGSIRRSADASGRATFDGLAAGRYRLNYGERARVIEVPATTRVRLR